MRKFTWRIFYSSAKCCSADIVLEALKAFSETQGFCFSSSTVMNSTLCYFESLQLSRNMERLLGLPGMVKGLKDSPLPPVPAQPSIVGERCSIVTLQLDSLGNLPCANSDYLKFWFPAHHFSSEMKAVPTLRNNSDQQQWVCTKEEQLHVFKEHVSTL